MTAPGGIICDPSTLRIRGSFKILFLFTFNIPESEPLKFIYEPDELVLDIIAV